MGGFKVDQNIWVPVVSTVLQRALIAVLSFYGLTGYISDNDMARLVSGLIAGVLIVIGGFQAADRAKALKKAEPYVPDHVLEKK